MRKKCVNHSLFTPVFFFHQPSQKVTNSPSLPLRGAHHLSFSFCGQWHFCFCSKSHPPPYSTLPSHIARVALMMQQFITEKAACDHRRTLMANIAGVNFDNGMARNKWEFDMFTYIHTHGLLQFTMCVCVFVCSFPVVRKCWCHPLILSLLPPSVSALPSLLPCTPPRPQHHLHFFDSITPFSPSFPPFLFSFPSFCPFVLSFFPFLIPPSFPTVSLCDHT